MQAHLRKHDMWGHIKIDGARVPLESHRATKKFKFSKMPKEKGWDLKIPHFEHLEISNFSHTKTLTILSNKEALKLMTSELNPWSCM